MVTKFSQKHRSKRHTIDSNAYHIAAVSSNFRKIDTRSPLIDGGPTANVCILLRLYIPFFAAATVTLTLTR